MCLYCDVDNVCAVCEFWVSGKAQNFWVRSMGSAVLFILRSRMFLYSARSGVNRVQVVLSEFSVRLFCFVQAKTLCRYVFLGCTVVVRLSVHVHFSLGLSPRDS